MKIVLGEQTIQGSMHNNSGPPRPCDKESALLSAEETYVGLMVRFSAVRDEEISAD